MKDILSLIEECFRGKKIHQGQIEGICFCYIPILGNLTEEVKEGKLKIPCKFYDSSQLIITEDGLTCMCDYH